MSQTTLPTQQFVAIKEIRGGVVFLKNGGLRKILLVNGINFDLKAEDEQGGILAAFQHFLNTIDFSVQFFIHSRKINIEHYLKNIEKRRGEEENELLKIQIDDYVSFVRGFVAENQVVEKSFFAVVPYDPLRLNLKSGGTFSFLFKKESGVVQAERGIEEQKNLTQLSQRVDEVRSGLESFGLKAEEVDDETLTELFYNLYNPAMQEKEVVRLAGQEGDTSKN